MVGAAAVAATLVAAATAVGVEGAVIVGALVLATGLVAVVTDVRTRRIPDEIAAGLGAGTAWLIVASEAIALSDVLAGMLVGGVPFLVTHVVRPRMSRLLLM